MKSSLRFCFFYIFLCFGIFQNNAFPQSPTPAPNRSGTAASDADSFKAEENLIHAGDLIDVDIVGSTEFDWRGNLSADGFLNNINFSEKPIYALCETEEAVAEKIADSYRKILRDPQVIVRILDRSARPLAVLYGAVRKNQRFQVKRSVSLNELIIISGGFSDQVSGDIQIFRPRNLNCSVKKNDSKPPADQAVPVNTNASATDEQFVNIKISDLLSGDKRFNPQILGGDVITVFEAKPLYVSGSVVAPKQLSVRASLTLSRAIDSAGGLAKDADATQIRIFRRAGVETKFIVADLTKIKAGQAADPDLQPFDVIDVPSTGRGRENFAPVVREFVPSEKQPDKLPLKIID